MSTAILTPSPTETAAPAGLEVMVPAPRAARPAWFAERAAGAWRDFQRLPLPGVKHEGWRYSNAKRITLAGLKPAAEPSAGDVKLAVERSQGLADAAARLVFVNDRLVRSHAATLPAGVVCVSFEDALRDHPDLLEKHFMRREAFLGSAKFAALHLAHVRAGTVVFVPAGIVLERPVEVFHWVAGEGEAVFPHTLVIGGEGSQLTVVDHYRSLGDGVALSCAVADIIAQKSARVTYIACQEMGGQGQALHLSSTVTHRDSQVKNFQIQLGASFSRSESVSDLVGENSRSDMLSISMPVGDQVVDQRTLQNHKAAHASSDLLYKNALYDRSRTVFSGLITVDEGAHYTDAYQTCRNLLNSDEAEANSMPGLEINADQVKCSHGSTSSPVSEEELFYLKARGIPDAESRKLVVLGFINDAVSRIGDEAIEAMILARLEEKFARVAV